MQLIDDIIIYTNNSWRELGAETRANGDIEETVCFSSSLVCVFESPECGQVCHIAALGAWVCGDVSAQCVY